VKPHRKNLVGVLAAVCFLALAFGLTLALHLATSAEGPCHHDSAHCALCQTMLAGATRLYLEPLAAVPSGDDPVAVVPEAGAVAVGRLSSIILCPRPPPAALA
jgi:hypothetical protein